MYSRSEFLRTSLHGSALIALTPAVPGFLAQTARAAGPARDGRVLVVVQLDGGNDGLIGPRLHHGVPPADAPLKPHNPLCQKAIDRVLRIELRQQGRTLCIVLLLRFTE